MVDTTDASFMSERLWLRLKRWTWVKIAFASVVLMSSFGFYQERQLQERETREAAQELIDKDYIACVRGNDTRQVVRNIVELTSTGSTDLTGIPGYEDLDPELQQFLINLRDATAEGGSEGFKKAALALLVIRDCEKEFPDASDGAGS